MGAIWMAHNGLCEVICYITESQLNIVTQCLKETCSAPAIPIISSPPISTRVDVFPTPVKDHYTPASSEREIGSYA